MFVVKVWYLSGEGMRSGETSFAASHMARKFYKKMCASLGAEQVQFLHKGKTVFSWQRHGVAITGEGDTKDDCPF